MPRMCSTISPTRVLWIWRAHRKLPPSFTEPKDDLFSKVKPKTTFERFALTDDEVGKPYSIYSEGFPDQKRHFARLFPDEAEYFPNTTMLILKIFTPVLGIRDLLVRIRIISRLFQFSQNLYEKREGSGAGSRSVPYL